MLDLFILRHAKSSWNDEIFDDFERTLNQRGKKNAQLMGQYFVSRAVQPDIVYCSKAKRCRATLKHLLSQGFSPLDQLYLNDLYLATSEEVLGIIKNTPGTVNSLMIIGHNPGLETLILKLCKDKTAPDYLSIKEKYPTAGFVHIKFELDTGSLSWSNLAPNSGTLYCYQTPKQLLAQDGLF